MTWSNAAYAFAPTAANTPYAAANALNQDPAVTAYPYPRGPEGGRQEGATGAGLDNAPTQATRAHRQRTPGRRHAPAPTWGRTAWRPVPGPVA